jgi:hypothetical protein
MPIFCQRKLFFPYLMQKKLAEPCESRPGTMYISRFFINLCRILFSILSYSGLILPDKNNIQIMSQLPSCPNCQSDKVVDKTANKFFLGAAIFSVLATIFIIAYWPVGIFLTVVMIFCLTATVANPKPVKHCKSCGNEWK